jgi:phycocyanin-associated, rod
MIKTMLGISSARIFVYEIEGLHQNDQTTQNNYPVRNSSNLLMQVPYNRMSDEMRRLNRLGARIVAIHPLGADLSVPSNQDEAPAEQEASV